MRGGQAEVRLGVPRLRRRRALSPPRPSHARPRAEPSPSHRSARDRGEEAGHVRTMSELSDTARHREAGEDFEPSCAHCFRTGNAGQDKSSTMISFSVSSANASHKDIQRRASRARAP